MSIAHGIHTEFLSRAAEITAAYPQGGGYYSEFCDTYGAFRPYGPGYLLHPALFGETGPVRLPETTAQVTELSVQLAGKLSPAERGYITEGSDSQPQQIIADRLHELLTFQRQDPTEPIIDSRMWEALRTAYYEYPGNHLVRHQEYMNRFLRSGMMFLSSDQLRKRDWFFHAAADGAPDVMIMAGMQEEISRTAARGALLLNRQLSDLASRREEFLPALDFMQQEVIAAAQSVGLLLGNPIICDKAILESDEAVSRICATRVLPEFMYLSTRVAIKMLSMQGAFFKNAVSAGSDSVRLTEGIKTYLRADRQTRGLFLGSDRVLTMKQLTLLGQNFLSCYNAVTLPAHIPNTYRGHQEPA